MKRKITLIIIYLLTCNFIYAQNIAAGGGHSLFLCSNGTVKVCGRNQYGQLGDGTNTNRNTPVLISSLSNITSVAAGNDHSLFLKNDGTVWACGKNLYGQLGDGTGTDSNTPIQVSSLSGIVAVAGGGGSSSGYSLFLKNDGTVWACGNNNYGQLGDGTTINRYIPVQISSLLGITTMEGGQWHSLFLKNDGTVWSCGRNQYGELGDGTTTQRNTPVQVTSLSGITAVAGGVDQYSLFLKNDGTAWACGYNGAGELGDGTNTNRISPVQVSTISGITSLTAGLAHSLFLINDGTVWACGYNAWGQLGDGTTANRNSPVQVVSLSSVTALAAGGSHSLYLKNDGTVWACGYNAYGQLGDGTNTDRHSPVQVTNLCQLPTAIADEQPINILSLSPNPATTTIFIERNTANTPATLQLLDCFGRKVEEIEIAAGEKRAALNVKSFAAGFYFVRMVDEKSSVIRKVVVQR